MSFHALVSGSLLGDPVQRTSAKGKAFATATLRVATEDGSILVSMAAFGDTAEALLQHRAGDAVAVAGRAKLTSWTGKDGVEKHGVSVTADSIVSAASSKRADADRRRPGPRHDDGPRHGGDLPPW